MTYSSGLKQFLLEVIARVLKCQFLPSAMANGIVQSEIQIIFETNFLRFFFVFEIDVDGQFEAGVSRLCHLIRRIFDHFTKVEQEISSQIHLNHSSTALHRL